MSELSYTIDIMDPFGVKLAQVGGFDRLELTRVVNAVGVLTLELDPHFDWSLFRQDGRLAVWRQPVGGPRSLLTETVWLVRYWQRAIDAQGKKVLRIKAYSALHVVTARIVAYPAGSSQAAKSSDPADDMMKAIIRENLGTLATDADRDWSAYLDVQVDLGLGPNLNKEFSRRPVLTVLQEIAADAYEQGTPVYFDVIAPTPDTLEFRTYVERRGMDHSLNSAQPVVISPARGNAGAAEVVRDLSDEITFVYAGGQGIEDNRAIQTASDAARIGASPFGRREGWRDARHVETTASLQAEAAAALREGRGRRWFEAEIRENEQTRFGVHWNWGDEVTAEYEGEMFDARVEAVSITVAGGEERIKAALRAEV